ncbi:MAG: hypothetical protein ABIT08_14840 [Bacteroidia bacterium]
MKNTTKLRHILQLYTLTLDVDDDENFHAVLVSKRNHTSCTFIDKAYSAILAKAFGHMMKEIKSKG